MVQKSNQHPKGEEAHTPKEGFIDRIKQEHPFAVDVIVVLLGVCSVAGFLLTAAALLFPRVLDGAVDALVTVYAGELFQVFSSLVRYATSSSNQAFNLFASAWSLVLMAFAVSTFRNRRALRLRGESTKLAWNHFLTTPLFVAGMTLAYFANEELGEPRILSAPPAGIWLTIAAIVMYLGVVLAVFSRLYIGPSWDAGISINTSEPPLVQDGPYSIVRHPLYAGLDIAYIGSVLVLFDGGVLPSIIAIVAIMVNCLRARREDEAMQDRYNDAWRDYKKRTPFIFPRIKR